MNPAVHAIERLRPPVSESDLRGLAELLKDAVDSGAAVSFITLTHEQGAHWWRRLLSAPASGAIVLVARDETGIAGSVHALPAWAPNQPHRADVVKLMVHRRARRRGIARALMQAIEREAGDAGFRQLVLDTRRGDAAEALYRALGWTEAGAIPRFALDTDGQTLHDAVIFFKELAR